MPHRRILVNAEELQSVEEMARIHRILWYLAYLVFGNLSLGMRHLVNAYEVEAGMM